jgi:hypothetical protein
MNVRRADSSDAAAVERISADAYTPPYQAICCFVPKPASAAAYAAKLRSSVATRAHQAPHSARPTRNEPRFLRKARSQNSAQDLSTTV